jgi:hypothetical protein
MKKFLLAALLLAVASPAWPRAAPYNETRMCVGKVEVEQYSNSSWYHIPDCHFDGAKEGKAIIDTCGIGNPCRAKTFGTWAVDYYIHRVIHVTK